MNLNADYLTIFALVLALEIPLIWHRGVNSAAQSVWEREGILRIATLVTLANALTHPLVFFGFMASGHPYIWVTLCGQGFAMLLKAAIYRGSTEIKLTNALQMAFWSTIISWQIAPILIFWAYN